MPSIRQENQGVAPVHARAKESKGEVSGSDQDDRMTPNASETGVV